MRKIKDYYFKKAKSENYSARSVYKLIEMDNKYNLIKNGFTILDVGCSPGSWSQYILKKYKGIKIVGIDISNKIEIKDKRFSFVHKDLFKIQPQELTEKSGQFDLVLSDVAPNTTGDKFLDSQISLRMIKKVFELANSILKKGGSVVAKVFQGEDLDEYIKSDLKNMYEKIFRFKPKSSRKESKEIYVVALNKKGG